MINYDVEINVKKEMTDYISHVIYLRFKTYCFGIEHNF